MSEIISSKEQISELISVLQGYLKLPFTEKTIPGSLMESVLSSVREAEILPTYDFVDVLHRQKRIGWQVKATKKLTPLTWKRAKIRDSRALIEASMDDYNATQELGYKIIEFCNDHARESIEKFDLIEIGYSRLIIDNDQIMYFERLLCTKEDPRIFHAEDFEWSWSKKKKTIGKEQLQSLHGIHKKSGKKYFAWHGMGENQLHFSGEKDWWPTSENMHKFKFPEDRISRDDLIRILSEIAKSD